MFYWAVRWGAPPRDTIRVSSKVMTPAEACKDCFGMVDAGMETAKLGTTRQEVKKAIKDGLEKRSDWKLMGAGRRSATPARIG
jgi:hypothetical protein